MAEAAAERAQLQHAALRLRDAMLARAWKAWADAAQRLVYKRQAVAGALCLIRQKLLARAWGGWAEAAEHAQRKAAKLRMAVASFRRRAAAAAWAAWRENARESAREKAAAVFLRNQVRFVLLHLGQCMQSSSLFIKCNANHLSKIVLHPGRRCGRHGGSGGRLQQQL